MSLQFQIETDRISLTWSQVSGTPGAIGPKTPPSGHLRISPLRPGLTFSDGNWRAEVPQELAGDPVLSTGPRIFEQTSYSLFAESRDGSKIEIRHRDPILVGNLNHSRGLQVQHGVVNFKNQVGKSTFSVLLDRQPELDFEVEVFPSKLDYVDDYQEILADVQELLTGLAVEYLRSTYHQGAAANTRQPSQVEWLTLLRGLLADLEKGLGAIARRPVWGLRRQHQWARPEQIRRSDGNVRRAVLRGKGSGPLQRTRNGLPVRSRLQEQRAKPSLDTPEHRWLATQLGRIRRRLAQLYMEERDRPRRYGLTDRDRKVLEEIRQFESRIDRLLRLSPIEAATGPPPAGFASLTLLSSPGYREAYRACLALMLGLRITGGPLQLSVKDLHLLYEYWCYFALLRLVAEVTGSEIPVRRLLEPEESGLRVRIRKGYRQSIDFEASGGREVSVTYNPNYSGEDFLVPQQPDLVISVRAPGWPTMQLVLDAKYRIDGSSEYLARQGSPGPPEDAINVLHRYRDAILEKAGGYSSEGSVARTVIHGSVLFPLHPESRSRFKDSRLWKSLQRLGIGALPFLPGETGLVAEWLRSVLNRGGWAIADQVLPHAAERRRRDWKAAASEPVLVGVLRGADPAGHLAWIKANGQYFAPYRPGQPRYLEARWVAIYSPTVLRSPGAVSHMGKVHQLGVVPRESIPTPWPSTRRGLQVLYQLASLETLGVPIPNQGVDGKGASFRQSRWSTRLGIERARSVSELSLETEPEWRLVEELQARGIEYRLNPGRPSGISKSDPRGRAWIITGAGRIQYRGVAGFFWEHRGRELDISQIASLVEKLKEQLANS